MVLIGCWSSSGVLKVLVTRARDGGSMGGLAFRDVAGVVDVLFPSHGQRTVPADRQTPG